MHSLILGFKKMNGVIVEAADADEQINPDTRRGRCMTLLGNSFLLGCTIFSSKKGAPYPHLRGEYGLFS